MTCPLLATLWLESPLFREFLRRSLGPDDPFRHASRTKLHVHHIFGGKTRKHLRSNTITICAAVHEFCHAHKTEGVIACLKWKRDHGQLNWEEIDQAAGCSVTGLLHSAIHYAGEPFRSWGESIYHERMSAVEAARRAAET